jgi:hypothetical protein
LEDSRIPLASVFLVSPQSLDAWLHRAGSTLV